MFDQPGAPQPPMPPQPQPQPKRRHTGRWIAAGVVLAAVIAGGATAASNGNGGAVHRTGTAIPSTTSAPTPTSASDANTVVATNPEPAYVKPTARDFTIKLKILTKDCFGSAGCNVTYRPELVMKLAAGSLDPTITYDITYELRGGDDAQTGTIYATGDSYEGPQEQIAGTSGQGVRLSAVITDVEAE